MAIDLAIDLNTGDLIMAPNGDIDIRSGQDTIDQRIRVRLKIYQGVWILDPTNGTLGSHLRDALRLPSEMAANMIPLMVKEALEPMSGEITVQDVQAVVSPEDSRRFDVTIYYLLLGSEDVQTSNLTIVG